MTISEPSIQHRKIPARDGYPLAASIYRPASYSKRIVLINSAVGIGRQFYRQFALGLARAGFVVATYDYRGIGESAPKDLRGCDARARDWALLDMAGVVDWARTEQEPDKLFLIGHSLGGQVTGLLDNASAVDGMITLSAQSGHWRLQGGEQKLLVWLLAYVAIPLLARLLGYFPWSRIVGGEDLPKQAALEWAGWCRNRDYVLGDESLPLHRYEQFKAPVLAYSFGDDKWGTPRAVDAMMRAYPDLARRHVEPEDVGLKSIGHVGFFKPASEALWREAIEWLDAR